MPPLAPTNPLNRLFTIIGAFLLVAAAAGACASPTPTPTPPST